MKGYVLIIGILAAIVSALITLNIFFQHSLQMEMAEQFNRQQLLLAKAEASNIQAYLMSLEHDLMHIAHFTSNLQMQERKDFLLQSDEVFKGTGKIETNLLFLDDKGDVFYSKWKEPLKKSWIRAMVEKSHGFCSSTVSMEQDKEKIYFFAPICRKGTFEGAAVLTVGIQDIAVEYLALIKSGSRGYAWMMDNKGDLLYHPMQPGMVGKNLYRTDSSCFKCHKSFDLEKKIIESKDEHYGIYVAPSGEDKVLAYSRAVVGDVKWIVAVSAPYSEVTVSIQRAMRFYSWLIILIFLTTSIISALLIVFYRKKLKAEEIERHELELEGYAENLERQVAKRTEELSSEKEKLNTIVSAIGSGIVLADVRGRIKWINQTMRELVGKDIVGTNCDEMCSDCTIVGSYAVNEMQTEIMSNLFGMTNRVFHLTTAPIKGDDGEVHGYVRLIQDVTEMKKMEEQMMHSEKLASLGRLTAGIAHEIGNPLTSVFSFVQILKDMEQDEFKKESLGIIYFHINRIAEILKQLSGFSKMPTVELREWNINNLIETSLSLILYDKRAKEITIMRDLSPALPEITTDGGQLSQVFVNLILNAVDAMTEGGTLTIRSRMTDGNIEISFEDTGVGITRENISRIFDPFFTTKEKGTGLGLAVSYSIIKKLNGGMTVESEVNKGTRFRITLPSRGER
ncbi:MAG: ATP-binding protein [Thermodesulfovibrionales bacterium]